MEPVSFHFILQKIWEINPISILHARHFELRSFLLTHAKSSPAAPELGGENFTEGAP